MRRCLSDVVTRNVPTAKNPSRHADHDQIAAIAEAVVSDQDVAGESCLRAIEIANVAAAPEHEITADPLLRPFVLARDFMDRRRRHGQVDQKTVGRADDLGDVGLCNREVKGGHEPHSLRAGWCPWPRTPQANILKSRVGG